MASVNKVIVLGRLGRDVELRYTPSGAAVANLSIATERSWKDKQGDKQKETEWHKVVLFDRLAEVAGEYLRKGSLAYIEGRLKTRKWQDKEGRDNYTTEIQGESLQLLGDKAESENRPHDEAPRKPSPPPTGRDTRTHGERMAEGRPAAARAPTGFDDMDDDIPF